MILSSLQRRLCYLLLTLCGLSAGCGDPAPSAPSGQGAECRISSDCDEDALCISGVCEQVNQGGEEVTALCTEQWDCPMGQRCDLDEWRCVERDCSSDEDCALGSLCDLGECLEDASADHDRDGVFDSQDNCPELQNAAQGDLDADGLGDACDEDIDGDGLLNDSDDPALKDLCPRTWSTNNRDLDEDGAGDVCDDDIDGDQLQNLVDNCPEHVNPDQRDTDGNGYGDECDDDSDADGSPDFTDNCPQIFNPDQYDQNRDREGDDCDEDIDGDGVPNQEDNCVFSINPDQADEDGDEVGNACADDIDGDGLLNADDNCPELNNADQRDSDFDGIGDTCDPDLDGDGVENSADNCPLLRNAEQGDVDEDGTGDRCDYDADNDGVANSVDNCPSVPNPDQSDENLNGFGDLCDPDVDGDGVHVDLDNCPLIGNSNQEDMDADQAGDACDDDIDGDGYPNEEDNCPRVPNLNQLDLDEDGLGDLCDLDRDGDDYPNELDNCPNVYNPNQARTSGLSVGDACASDRDLDHVFDDLDNCPDTFNPTQLDSDADQVGDLCDFDQDGDGVNDSDDNCPFTANPDQSPAEGDASRGVDCEDDLDGDGILDSEEEPGCEGSPQDPNLFVDVDDDGVPDECDDDLDNDGVPNELDGCPFAPNSLNDLDGDGLDNACDDDIDGDGLLNSADNCPLISNPDQRDIDQNGVGDICEADDDLDGVPNGQDLCPGVPLNEEGDLDGDGVGDSCDVDLDNDGLSNVEPQGGQKNEDGIPTYEDNCVGLYNPDQGDSDGDGIGDACDNEDPSLVDRDSDGHPDVLDNCLHIYNPSQDDLDRDLLGDACDPDLDGDGINEQNEDPTLRDNCPRRPNADQRDLNGDLIGDLCEADLDGDLVLDRDDNCPLLSNPSQRDSDDDGLGDRCDPDADDDGVPNDLDNCPSVPNPNQEDININRIGDRCEVDQDGDGRYDFEDLCPTLASPYNGDLDRDGIGNPCDDDLDGDGHDNDVDNCPYHANQAQEDSDGDGWGELCALDHDGDGVPNELDNCPSVYNPLPPSMLRSGQFDLDGDGIGDDCDDDLDGDGHLNNDDNCPLISNPEQTNNDLSIEQDSGLPIEGDACDRDLDGDGVLNVDDNCPDVANEDQLPHPIIRSLGLVCVPDADNDRQPDFFDNCPLDYNDNQSDLDQDGVGDACDDDSDNDGVVDDYDNCVFTPNPSQENSTLLPYGDACRDDIDNDGLINTLDPCPLRPNQLLAFDPSIREEDIDGDGLYDACDPDADGDGVNELDAAGDRLDNCPRVPNANQSNIDNDLHGDACDIDLDGDGFANTIDNCVFVPNPTQEDSDGDLFGDACDSNPNGGGPVGGETPPAGGEAPPAGGEAPPAGGEAPPPGGEAPPAGGEAPPAGGETPPSGGDTGTGGTVGLPELNVDSDGDLVPDVVDNCPSLYNPDQADYDGDGEGDRCLHHGPLLTLSSNDQLFIPADVFKSSSGLPEDEPNCNETGARAFEIGLVPPSVDRRVELSLQTTHSDMLLSLKAINTDGSFVADSCTGDRSRLTISSQGTTAPYRIFVIAESVPEGIYGGVYLDVQYALESFQPLIVEYPLNERTRLLDFDGALDENGDRDSELVMLSKDASGSFQWSADRLDGAPASLTGGVINVDYVTFSERDSSYSAQPVAVVTENDFTALSAYIFNATIQRFSNSAIRRATGNEQIVNRELQVIPDETDATGSSYMVMARTTVFDGTNAFSQLIEMYSLSTSGGLSPETSINNLSTDTLSAQVGYFEGLGDAQNPHSPVVITAERSAVDGATSFKAYRFNEASGTFDAGALIPFVNNEDPLLPAYADIKLRALNNFTQNNQTELLVEVSVDNGASVNLLSYDANLGAYHWITLAGLSSDPLSELVIGDLNGDQRDDLILLTLRDCPDSAQGCYWGTASYRVDEYIFSTPSGGQPSWIAPKGDPVSVRSAHITPEGELALVTFDPDSGPSSPVLKTFKARADFDLSAPEQLDEIPSKHNLASAPTFKDAELYDVDGDGLIDVLYVVKGTGGGDSARLFVQYGLLDGRHGQAIEVSNLDLSEAFEDLRGQRFSVGDLNGDRLADLAWVQLDANSNEQLMVALGSPAPNLLSEQRVTWDELISFDGVDTSNHSGLQALQLARVDGDELDDLIWVAALNSGAQIYYLSGAHQLSATTVPSAIHNVATPYSSLSFYQGAHVELGVRLTTDQGSLSIYPDETGTPTVLDIAGVPACTERAYFVSPSFGERLMCIHASGPELLSQGEGPISYETPLPVADYLEVDWRGTGEPQHLFVGSGVSLHGRFETQAINPVTPSRSLISSAALDLNGDHKLDLLAVDELGGLARVYNRNPSYRFYGRRARVADSAPTPCPKGSFDLNIDHNEGALSESTLSLDALNVQPSGCRLASLLLSIDADTTPGHLGHFILIHEDVDTSESGRVYIPYEHVLAHEGQLNWINTPQLSLFEGDFPHGLWRLIFEEQGDCGGGGCPNVINSFGLSPTTLDQLESPTLGLNACPQVSDVMTSGCVIRRDQLTQNFRAILNGQGPDHFFIELPGSTETQEQTVTVIASVFTNDDRIQLRASPYRLKTTLASSTWNLENVSGAEVPDRAELRLMNPSPHARLFRVELSAPPSNTTNQYNVSIQMVVETMSITD